MLRKEQIAVTWLCFIINVLNDKLKHQPYLKLINDKTACFFNGFMRNAEIITAFFNRFIY